LREERRLRVFENRVLRRVFGPKREEVTGEWRKLQNEELNYLYSPPNIVQVIKTRTMRWAGHVARMEERRGVYRVLMGKPEEKRPIGRFRYIYIYIYIYIYWRVILRCMFGKWDVGIWTGSMWLGTGTGDGLL